MQRVRDLLILTVISSSEQYCFHAIASNRRFTYNIEIKIKIDKMSTDLFLLIFYYHSNKIITVNNLDLILKLILSGT